MSRNKNEDESRNFHKTQTRNISFDFKITKKGNRITIQRKGFFGIKKKYKKVIRKYEQMICKYEESIRELNQDLMKLSEERNNLFIDIKMGYNRHHHYHYQLLT
jgi:hypothetical protein